MNINPMTLLDSILADYASPRARRAIHSLLLLAAVLVVVWMTAEGNWKEAVLALVAAVYAGANQANTPATPVAAEDDGLTYEGAGGLSYPEGATDLPYNDYGYGPTDGTSHLDKS